VARSAHSAFLVALFTAFVVAAPSAQATTLDLTCIGCDGVINGALYTQIDPQATGTGVLMSFAQISPTGNTESSGAYNTTVNNTLENGTSDIFNHSILLSDVPIVTVAGVDYYEFILDVNEADQQGIGKYISLDEVQIFVGGTANSSVDTFTAGILDHDGTLVYQMDAGTDSWVALDFQLNSGSGSGDMQLLVAVSAFGGASADSVVTLYSEFGQQGLNPSGVPAGNYGQSDGFEEWALNEATGGGTTPPVPEPSAALVFGIGAVLMGARVQRKF
jgi:hypothetical protein